MNSDQANQGVRMLEVNENQAGQRIDNLLISLLKGVPKSRIYRLIRKGEVRVNKKRVKPEHKLEHKDLVRVPPVRVASREEAPPAGQGLLALIKTSVLYEDPELLVINKASGIAVHGGTGVKIGLIDALRQLYPKQQYLELIHRLDKGTSGCIMLAKSARTLRALSADLKTGRVKKTYHALAQGNWPDNLSQVSASLRRNTPRGGERTVSVSEDGKVALTRFKVLKRFKSCTLVEARPETGRTHQIRVHAQLSGCPILGDDKYGEPAFNRHLKKLGIKRLCLHARQLEFTLPGKAQPIRVSAPYDEQFESAISIMAGQAEDSDQP